MRKRDLRLLAIVGLLAMAVLSFRPVAMQVVGAQMDPRNIEVQSAVTDDHCLVVSACQALSVSGLSFDNSAPPILPIMAAFLAFTVMIAGRRMQGKTFRLLNPPPRFS